MTSPIVVFDLDGTLIDTAADLVAGLNHAIAQKGLEPVTYEDLTHLVGHGAKAMIERTYSLRQKELTDEDLRSQLETFIAYYSDTMPGLSKPYPGVLAAMDALSAQGFKLAVCTNKMEALARKLLDTLDLTARFAAITGGDTFAVRKPNAEHLLSTIAMADADPTQAIMIGDSLNDILVARNASIPSIGVPFGYSDVPIEDLNPTQVIHHFDELNPELVYKLLRQ